jgi:hypothetical protein
MRETVGGAPPCNALNWLGYWDDTGPTNDLGSIPSALSSQEITRDWNHFLTQMFGKIQQSTHLGLVLAVLESC